MEEVILIKEGEIFLKGLNKKNFEIILMKNIKKRLNSVGDFKIEKQQSTMTIFPGENFNLEEALKKISTIFGIASFSRACIVKKDFELIKKTAKKYLADFLVLCKTFKVDAKRSDKTFKLASPSICGLMGEFLLAEFSNLAVDLKNPDIVVNVEIRDFFAYIYCSKLKKRGAKGVPIKSTGDAMLLISGGIDSPVAGWMMAKRGLNLKAVHFVSPPYTGARALQKVEDLVLKLSEWTEAIPFFIVNVTKLQEELKKNCPVGLLTVILRRAMIKIAEKIAIDQNNLGYGDVKALITGESLAQVASQTLGAINCTNSVSSMPIFRPLIGMDKEEIVELAKKIETFNISILPYEDCCTVFTPKHPKTNPKIYEVENAEKKLDYSSLIEDCACNFDFKLIGK